MPFSELFSHWNTLPEFVNTLLCSAAMSLKCSEEVSDLLASLNSQYQGMNCFPPRIHKLKESSLAHPNMTLFGDSASKFGS